MIEARPEEAAGLVGWHIPRLPIGGGDLIKRGLPEGPVIARTLREIEDRWVNAGFPAGEDFLSIVDQVLKSD